MLESTFFFLVNLSWQIAFVSALAWAGLKFTRVQSPQIKRLVWLSVILSPVVFVLMSAAPSKLSVYRLDKSVLSVEDPIQTPTSQSETPSPSAPASLEPRAHQLKPDIDLSRRAIPVLTFAWIVGVAFSLFRIAGGYWKLRTLIARSDPVMSGPLLRAFNASSQAMGLTRKVRLSASSNVKTPFALAGFPAHIVFPSTLPSADLRLRMICTHEQIHLKQYDDWFNLISRIIGAFLFFHPLYHLAVREIEIASEEACDSWSIRLTESREDYASCLVEFAKQNIGQLPIGFSESGRALSRRLQAIFRNSNLLNRLDRRKLIGLGAALVGLILIVSLARIVDFNPTAPEKSAISPVQNAFIAELTQGLDNPSVSVRRRVVEILSEIGEPAVPALITALGDEKESVQHRAIRALREIGGPAAPAVPALIEALARSNRLRNEAIETLGQIGPPAEPAVPHLTALLASPSKSLRSRTVRALGKIRTPSQTAISALIQLLQDPSKDVRKRADEALIRIGEPAVPALATALENADAPGRSDMVALMGKIGTPAIPTLIKTLRDPSDRQRLGAADALGDMKTTSPEAIAALINALEDSSSRVRWEVVDALGDLQVASPIATDALIKTLNADASESVRERAIQALGEAGTPRRGIVAALIEALGDKSEKIRHRATVALKNIGAQKSQASDNSGAS